MMETFLEERADSTAEADGLMADNARLREQLQKYDRGPTTKLPADYRPAPMFSAETIHSWAAYWCEKLEVDAEGYEPNALAPLKELAALSEYLRNVERNYAKLLGDLKESGKRATNLVARCEAYGGELLAVNGRLKARDEEIRHLKARVADLERQNNILEDERDAEIHRADAAVAEAQTFGVQMQEKVDAVVEDRQQLLDDFEASL